MEKMTYNERIHEKLNKGISHIQAEIEVTREDADAKIAELKRRQETENSRIREIMIAVLKEDHPPLFDEVEAKARRQFEAATEKRRSRAKGVSTSVPRNVEESQEFNESGHSQQ